MKLIPGKHLGKVTTVDRKTGKETESKGTMMLLGPGPGVCQECAVDHPPAQPHNAQSLAYQYFFYNEHGRWPNWDDAMAHCSESMKQAWRQELTRLGVDLADGRINPGKSQSKGANSR